MVIPGSQDIAEVSSGSSLKHECVALNHTIVKPLRPSLRRGQFDSMSEVGYQSECDEEEDMAPRTRRSIRRTKAALRRAKSAVFDHARPRKALVGLGINIDTHDDHSPSPDSYDRPPSPLMMMPPKPMLRPLTLEDPPSPLELPSPLKLSLPLVNMNEQPSDAAGPSTQVSCQLIGLGMGLEFRKPTAAPTPPSAQFESIFLGEPAVSDDSVGMHHSPADGQNIAAVA